MENRNEYNNDVIAISRFVSSPTLCSPDYKAWKSPWKILLTWYQFGLGCDDTQISGDAYNEVVENLTYTFFCIFSLFDALWFPTILKRFSGGDFLDLHILQKCIYFLTLLPPDVSFYFSTSGLRYWILALSLYIVLFTLEPLKDPSQNVISQMCHKKI